MNNLCQHGCGKPAIFTTKGSAKNGPYGGLPVHQCSKSHNACQAVKERKLATSRARYGTDYPWQVQEIRDRATNTCLEKYGSVSSLQNTEVQAKRKATMLAKYGVEEPAQNKKLLKKMTRNMKAAYLADPHLGARRAQTRLDKYGEGLSSITEKNRRAQIASGRWVDPSKKSDWKNYKDLVRKITAANYKKFRDIINPDNLPISRSGWTIDHIFSIRAGFENNVPPDIIASVSNLRMLWHIENKQKHIRCDCSLNELYERACPLISKT